MFIDNHRVSLACVCDAHVFFFSFRVRRMLIRCSCGFHKRPSWFSYGDKWYSDAQRIAHNVHQVFTWFTCGPKGFAFAPNAFHRVFMRLPQAFHIISMCCHKRSIGVSSGYRIVRGEHLHWQVLALRSSNSEREHQSRQVSASATC